MSENKPLQTELEQRYVLVLTFDDNNISCAVQAHIMLPNSPLQSHKQPKSTSHSVHRQRKRKDTPIAQRRATAYPTPKPLGKLGHFPSLQRTTKIRSLLFAFLLLTLISRPSSLCVHFRLQRRSFLRLLRILRVLHHLLISPPLRSNLPLKPNTI